MRERQPGAVQGAAAPRGHILSSLPGKGAPHWLLSEASSSSKPSILRGSGATLLEKPSFRRKIQTKPDTSSVSIKGCPDGKCYQNCDSVNVNPPAAFSACQVLL